LIGSDDLAHLLCSLGRLDEAEDVYRASYEHRCIPAGGARHPQTLKCASGLARVLCMQDKLDDSEATYRRTLTALTEEVRTVD
jgi:hypothetical protein